jgi:hypothetical protein
LRKPSEGSTSLALARSLRFSPKEKPSQRPNKKLNGSLPILSFLFSQGILFLIFTLNVQQFSLVAFPTELISISDIAATRSTFLNQAIHHH